MRSCSSLPLPLTGGEAPRPPSRPLASHALCPREGADVHAAALPAGLPLASLSAVLAGNPGSAHTCCGVGRGGHESREGSAGVRRGLPGAAGGPLRSRTRRLPSIPQASEQRFQPQKWARVTATQQPPSIRDSRGGSGSWNREQGTLALPGFFFSQAPPVSSTDPSTRQHGGAAAAPAPSPASSSPRAAAGSTPRGAGLGVPVGRMGTGTFSATPRGPIPAWSAAGLAWVCSAHWPHCLPQLRDLLEFGHGRSLGSVGALFSADLLPHFPCWRSRGAAWPAIAASPRLPALPKDGLWCPNATGQCVSGPEGWCKQTHVPGPSA